MIFMDPRVTLPIPDPNLGGVVPSAPMAENAPPPSGVCLEWQHLAFLSNIYCIFCSLMIDSRSFYSMCSVCYGQGGA